MQRVKSRAPASFKAQVTDTEKRLNILFDHLNNEDLLKLDTVSSMTELAQALQARNYEQAQAIQMDVMLNKMDECGNWMVSLLRPPCISNQQADRNFSGWGKASNQHEQSDTVGLDLSGDCSTHLVDILVALSEIITSIECSL